MQTVLKTTDYRLHVADLFIVRLIRKQNFQIFDFNFCCAPLLNIYERVSLLVILSIFMDFEVKTTFFSSVISESSNSIFFAIFDFSILSGIKEEIL